MKDHALKMPEAENGFVKTLNNMGFMTVGLDEFSREFVEFAMSCGGPALDIGCAYGNATLAALRAGAEVFANDVDPRHTEITVARAKEAGVDARLTVISGAFPNEMIVPEDRLGAVLACRVFHFFDGPMIERGTELVARWLRPGGKFFLVTETPFLGTMKPFIPIYEKRRAEGTRWPGYIDDFATIDPIRAKDLPKSMHLLDEEVLRRTFEAAGLLVERAHKIARPDFPPYLQLDGRESVGIIGRKPERNP